MFRHRGKRRTYQHNLRLASMLSFVAGMVNVGGVLGLQVLTTNVTGHFAFFAEELSKKAFSSALAFLAFIFFFLLGAFTSNSLVEIFLRHKPKIAHSVPMIVEVVVLLSVGLFASNIHQTKALAGMLLFAMGLQNALVTSISTSTVRTTHLTGLFTDLGIELSQLLFYRQSAEQQQLNRRIFLRIIIIVFFFSGGVAGGLLFGVFSFHTFLFAAFVLIVALFYDLIRYRLYWMKRKLR